MRTDEADQEGAEDGMDTDDAGEEGRTKHHEDCQSDDRLGRPVVDRVGALQDPHEGRSYSVDEEEDIGDRSQQDVEGGNAGSSVDKGHAEGEQDPAKDIVANACREDDHSDLGLKQL